MRGGVLFIYTLFPLHAGGEAVLGPVDLPIQREKPLDFPIIQSSEIKGALRSFLKDKNLARKFFGSPPEESPTQSGSAIIADAKLLLYPVKSLKGTFAWITCPLILERFLRDLEIVGLTGFKNKVSFEVLKEVKDDKALAAPQSENKIDRRAVLEEIEVEIEEREEVRVISEALKEFIPEEKWKEKLTSRFIIVNDDLFRKFTKFYSYVVTRVRLTEEKVVDEGPWTVEALPPETLLYSPLLFIPQRAKDEKLHEDFKSQFDGKVVQIGGDETLGWGFSKLKVEVAGDEGEGA